MCRLRAIAMHDYQESVTTGQTDIRKSYPYVPQCFAGNAKIVTLFWTMIWMTNHTNANIWNYNLEDQDLVQRHTVCKICNRSNSTLIAWLPKARHCTCWQTFSLWCHNQMAPQIVGQLWHHNKMTSKSHMESHMSWIWQKVNCTDSKRGMIRM